MIKKLLPAVLVLCFIGCHKVTECPSYSEDHLEWLPYDNGGQTTFSSGGSSQTYVFDDVFMTKQYTIGRTEACNCEAFAHAYSAVDSTGNIQLRCSSEKQKIRYKFAFEFQHYGMMANYYVPRNIDRFTFSIKNDGTVENATWKESEMIGGRMFDNVIVVEIDTIFVNTTSIYKLYLAKGYGVVRYDYRSGQSFVITD
ncbi:MAG: hypothetical protein J6T98_10240 [Salinivirgaceae bacterium]|nr:hypothetical protein [Salinivirgaceae bacterium]